MVQLCSVQRGRRFQFKAGWGALLFAVLPDQSTRFLGVAWGPVTSSALSGYFLCAARPTIPVAELQAVVFALRLVRSSRFRGSICWGSDSLYALGIMVGSMAVFSRAAVGVHSSC